MQFDDEWAQEAAHKEQSAQDRDLESKRKRWSELDRQELQGKSQTQQRAKQERRAARWRKTWPWLVFFGLAAALMILARVLGY